MKQYLVVGLGRFGTSVAQTLYESNEEILAIDIDEEKVQDCINENIVDNAIRLDSTDLKSLKELGIGNYDIAFVCVGDIEPSILITLNLKELGVKKIIAKAVSKSHGKVLAKIGANKVIYPEEYMGRRVAQLAMEPNLVEHLRFSADFLLLEVKAPSVFWNKSIIELDIRKNYNSNVVGIKKEDQSFNPNPLPTTVIEKGDVLLVITDSKTADFFENLK
ncbi:Ktr system potassium uptake protein A [Fusobacterium necrogenes]|uniref:Ktr system potassium uptake protein A n=1 Tax=Fusobacterium necrogenes TaxID=858 RepID=A0A377GWW9_9FUSO|nr:TrkA family potassium uptake protein [Fusobacterium necrogenes]STO31262.1 Ktr system potassium uptake protein A [Fusobacterium necrogenes]